VCVRGWRSTLFNFICHEKFIGSYKRNAEKRSNGNRLSDSFSIVGFLHISEGRMLLYCISVEVYSRCRSCKRMMELTKQQMLAEVDANMLSRTLDDRRQMILDLLS